MSITARFALGGASLNWGNEPEATADDEPILLGDCTPHTLESY